MVVTGATIPPKNIKPRPADRTGDKHTKRFAERGKANNLARSRRRRSYVLCLKASSPTTFVALKFCSATMASAIPPLATFVAL